MPKARLSPIQKFSNVLFHESRTKVMGVINTTPDSFSDGGIHFERDAAIASGLDMLEQGADILDIGGESTRPGSLPVGVDEEIRRTIPVISGICSQAPDAVVSIDTRRKAVADAATEAGAVIINDVSGFRDDPELAQSARDNGAFLVVMHMLGAPRNMQTDIHYDSFPGDIVTFFKQRIADLEKIGVAPEKIILDPGIGFGKTFNQNLILINRLQEFSELGKPLLMGPSRKAFIGTIIGEPEASKRDVATMAAICMSICRGAAIVRAHDVRSTVQVARVTDAILRERVEM
ncbi:MAG: dihydropteroate synthase [Desulfomonilaceae bacterium]